ncbi:alpha-taxilin-like isoform X3 [Mytilus californianus]|uniref:alpha-taxilin-like isoform X3 n=1 Tax=Mytilus californianus TaxID=6549 RepID=UPI002246F6B5|nr:alpha-taxilin-like isoform X3 [Mytilus californianus]
MGNYVANNHGGDTKHPTKHPDEREQIKPVTESEVVQVTQPVNESFSKQEIKSELSSGFQHQVQIATPCEQISDLATVDTDQAPQTFSASDQSVAWLEQEVLSEDLSDLDCFVEPVTLSVVEVKSVLKYPRKDSVTVYQQDSCDCDIDSKCEERSLVDVEDLNELEHKQSFPVGPLQSFDYYHQLIAEDLRIIEVMEKVETFATEQLNQEQGVNSEISGLSESALSSLVQQMTAPDPAERDGSPDSQNGSMHASTGSEGLEEALSRDLKINGEKADPPEGENKNKKKEETERSDSKDRTKIDKKSKKKEDKTIGKNDHILRALSSLQTTEEKLAALCKKYADLHEEHRTLNSTVKQLQRKLSVTTREKDQLQTEHTKAVMAKSKLEGLCRELQKHNQVIRQESLQRAREEDEKRKEISGKFQTTIGEIQQQMQDHHERNTKLREENTELASKLKKFIEQYETREKQVEKVMQHRELEQKLADARLAQSNAILKEEQERSKKEKEVLLLQATEAQKKSVLLEAQLNMYKERYEEFQSTINKSNDMFQKFKTEMDKMTKRIKKLEKDGAAWKNKWENANKALLDMVEEKQAYDKEKPMLLAKINKLESLCRAMQAERLGRKVLEASGMDMTKLETEASGKAATGEVSESTSTKTPADGAADGDTPTLDEGTVCSEENTSPSSCDDKTQACSADSTTQQGETCDTSPGEDPSNTNQDNSNQSDDATGNLSQSNDVSVPDSSGQA